MTCAQLNMKSDHPLGHLMMLIALESVRASDFTLPLEGRTVARRRSRLPGCDEP
jgi:hypothetical protein